jgi:drug/metabolite transporter (DMT)-like permease
MPLILAIVFAFGTAMTNAASATLQWHAASTAPEQRARGWKLAVYLLHRPEYLAAIGALTLSFLLQAAALHEGAVVLVQPLLVTELPFTLVLSAIWLGLRTDRRELLGIGSTCAGLAILLGVGQPHGGRSSATATTWLLAGVVTAGVIVALVLAGRGRPQLRKSVPFALASGLAFSITALLVKATTARLRYGIGQVFTSWPVYAMVLAGVLAVLLQQHAMRAGSLAAAKTATTVINPVASILLGVTVFGETFTGGFLVAVEALGALIMVAGIIELGRSPLVTGQRQADPRHEQRFSKCSRRPPTRYKAGLTDGAGHDVATSSKPHGATAPVPGAAGPKGG